jgi:serine/threonine protein kinase
VEHYLSRNLCEIEAGQRFTIQRKEFVVGGKIGDGAAGLVRKALRIGDNAEFAIKILAPDPKYIDEAAFDEVARRFKREGERGARLNHPNLLRIFAYCENVDGNAFNNGTPKNPFLVMEFVQGKTLEGSIRGCPEVDRGIFLLTPYKLHIAIQITEALEYLHRSKLIHRDVKPANIFLSKKLDGRGFPTAILGDFGVMKWGDYHTSLSTGTLTATNQKGLGTLKYMAPEQAVSPQTVSVRSDIFPMGITLFELFASRILASPHHVYEIMYARLSRGTTASRYSSMGYRLDSEDEGLAALLLDMHLRGASGRPPIEKVRGKLDWEYDRRWGAR